jgi:5-methylcytosine-specific restriction endonuclease McrA
MVESKRRRNVHARVYEKSGWQCEMPVCIAATRDIDQGLLGSDDPLAPSVDHVIQRSDGGVDNESNMRAAHRECNKRAGRLRRGMRQNIGDLYPDLLLLAREIVRSN